MADKKKIILDPHHRKVSDIFEPVDLDRLYDMVEVVWGRDEPMSAEVVAQVAKDEIFAIVAGRWRHGRTADNRGHKHQVSMSSKVSFEGRPRCMGGDQRGGGMRKSNSSTTDQR